MELLEYQAKELFNQVGIPTLPSQTIYDFTEIKYLQVPYPVVLKSQVRAGGRGKAGGVRFVENTIDAIAAARAIFNLPIGEEYPEVILAEARYNPKQEFFLAIILDYQLQCPVLLGSIQGGVNLDILLENLQTVVIDTDFSPFYARRLGIKMGLTGKLIESVSDIIQKMYELFQTKDLEIIEINPLGINAEGELMALDGKITINDYALQRHPDIINLIETQQKNLLLPKLRTFKSQDKTGNIAIISNSYSLGLAVWDLIVEKQAKPRYCFVLAEFEKNSLQRENFFEKQLEIIVNKILSMENINVVLFNILGSSETIKTMSETIIHFLQPRQLVVNPTQERIERPTGVLFPSRFKNSEQSEALSTRSINQLQFVLRLAGTNLDDLETDLSLPYVYWLDNLDDAISKTVSLAEEEES